MPSVDQGTESSDQNPGRLGYEGDEQLPSCVRSISWAIS